MGRLRSYRSGRRAAAPSHGQAACFWTRRFIGIAEPALTARAGSPVIVTPRPRRDTRRSRPASSAPLSQISWGASGPAERNPGARFTERPAGDRLDGDAAEGAVGVGNRSHAAMADGGGVASGHGSPPGPAKEAGVFACGRLSPPPGDSARHDPHELLRLETAVGSVTSRTRYPTHCPRRCHHRPRHSAPAGGACRAGRASASGVSSVWARPRPFPSHDPSAVHDLTG